MPIHPVELLLTGKLLKKAQDFRELMPAPEGLPAMERSVHPGLVVELLPLIQQLAPEWIPQFAQKIKAIADAAGVTLPITPEHIKAGLESWVSHPAHEHTPTYMVDPPPRYMGRPAEQTQRSGGLTAEDAYYMSSWGRQFDEYVRRFRSKYPTSSPLDFLSSLLDYNARGASTHKADFVPSHLATPGQHIRVQTYPSTLIKVDHAWPSTYLHELGHGLHPNIPLVDPVTQDLKSMSAEVSNAALLRVLEPVISRYVAKTHPTPFSAQALGQLFGRVLGSYAPYLEYLAFLDPRLTVVDLPPSVNPIILDPQRVFSFEADPEWKRLFAEAFMAERPDAKPKNPELQQYRRLFMNALNHLVAMGELAIHRRLVGNETLVDILKALQQMRSPTPTMLYNAAVYGPRDFSEARDLVEHAASKHPAIKKSPAYEIAQLTLEPQLFKFRK